MSDSCSLSFPFTSFCYLLHIECLTLLLLSMYKNVVTILFYKSDLQVVNLSVHIFLYLAHILLCKYIHEV